MAHKNVGHKNEGCTAMALRLGARREGVSAAELEAAGYSRNAACKYLIKLKHRGALTFASTSRMAIRYFADPAHAAEWLASRPAPPSSADRAHRTRSTVAERARTNAALATSSSRMMKPLPALAPTKRRVPKPDRWQEPIITSATKVTIAPPFRDTRYVCDGPVIGGFLSEWYSLRGA